jgi:hypothetical protein
LLLIDFIEVLNLFKQKLSDWQILAKKKGGQATLLSLSKILLVHLSLDQITDGSWR